MDISTTTLAARDVSQIAGDEASERAWPGPAERRSGRFQVLIKRSVLNEIHRHGRSVDRIEICGALVGTLCRDDRGPYLYIQASIPGQHAESQNTSVTFTAETWTAIQAEMDRSHADQKILGWYHTHPGFGVFLSGMDLFIQEHFFGLPWQIALVYDPISHEDGLFLWRQGKPAPDTLLIEEDEPEEEFEPQPTIGYSAPATGNVADLEAQVRILQRQQRWLMLMVLLLAIFAFVWAPLLVLAMADRRLDPRIPLPPASQPAESTVRSAV